MPIVNSGVLVYICGGCLRLHNDKDHYKMIVITGAAGFIGSCLWENYLESGEHQLVLVDDWLRPEKQPNFRDKLFQSCISRDHFHAWLDQHHEEVHLIYHLGARTDTTETDTRIFDRLNLHYSMQLWEQCSRYEIPLIYASSAATYGAGERGYRDDHALVNHLRPLNPYGVSKNDFDQWALQQEKAPPFWAGLKFFNVYGPNEYHKGRMASVIFHTLRQIRSTGTMKLFRSHRSDFADGAQSRDFIYVKDVVSICRFLASHQPESGLYNVGTGEARTFLDLATLTFRAMQREPRILFVDTPEDIRDTYQYFTEADMQKLRRAGYSREFYSLERGIHEYVTRYLSREKIW